MDLIKRLIKQLSVVKRHFLIGVALVIVSSIILQGAPLIIRFVIDNLITPMATQHVDYLSDTLVYTGLFILVTILGNIAMYYGARILMFCANKVAENLRNRTYDHMQQMPISYFDDQPAGKISSRIINNTETLRQQFYGTLLNAVLLNIIPIIVIYIIVMTMNPFIGSVLVLLLPVFYFWQKLYQKQTEEPMATYYETQSDVNTMINEVMAGSTIIQLFHQEKQTIAKFEESTQKSFEAENKLSWIDASISWSLVESFKRFSILLMLAFVGYQFLGNALGLSIGFIYVYVNYIERLFNHLGVFVRVFPNIQRSLETGRRVFELLDSPVEEDNTNIFEMGDGQVVFQNVVFGYTDKKVVLKDISITVQSGQTIALVGHTGSGKSSIINLLMRFYDPQKGSIIIDGQNTRLYNRESVRRQMGIVLQDPYLFTGTIASNVSMDDDTISEEAVLEALIKVGAKEMIDSLPKGIHEPVVEKGSSFSSGQRQLISFARALASNPKILILDEATSHIDTQTESIIQHAMDVVRDGRTTFIIAHRLSTIQNADQILVLSDGEIVERGTHEELLNVGGYYAQMYQTQKKMA